VEDDVVGFRPLMRKDTGMGQDLVSGLAGELAGHLKRPSAMLPMFAGITLQRSAA
jgi:hypothetical protein